METDPLQWLPNSFYRQPHWRWLQAEYLIATGRRMNARIDDEWVSTARKVLQGHRTESASKVAAVRAAREIQFGKPAVKEEWEARLLTEEPLERFAERFAVPTIVVEAFSELFFGVRSMRKATDWLLAPSDSAPFADSRTRCPTRPGSSQPSWADLTYSTSLWPQRPAIPWDSRPPPGCVLTQRSGYGCVPDCGWRR